MRAGALAAVLALAVTTSACGGSDSKATKPPTTSDRKAAEACPAKDTSQKSDISFTNNSSLPIQLQVPDDSWSCDGFDGPSNPGALNGILIQPGSTVTRGLELYLARRNKWSVIFRAPYKSGKCCAIVALGPTGKVDLQHYSKSDLYTSADGWLAGLTGTELTTTWNHLGYADGGRALRISYADSYSPIPSYGGIGRFTISDG